MDNVMLRRASLEDLDTIIAMTADFFKESRWGSAYQYSGERWGIHMAYCQSYGFLWVKEDAGEVIAYMAGVVGPMMFSEAQVATELALYVRPDKRTGRTAIGLINRFVEWAQSKGCVECVSGSSAGINSDSVRRIYEYCDFVQAGDLMYRRL